MAVTETLTLDYGYTAYRYSGGTADIIDASEASWIVANTGNNINRYPFLVDNGKTGLDIIGGTVRGEVSQTADWSDAYVNSAAVMVRNTRDASISDWTITRPWDGIRVAGSSGGFEISDVRVSEARDDAVENDDGLSGTIRDSLFDGVFSGISLGNKNTPNRSSEVVTIDGVLLRMESYLYRGDVTHGSPMKMENGSPALRITNTVFAIEDVTHIGYSRLELAWDKLIESSGNVFLNLSNTPLPSNYPMPPSGWTVLQGQAARDYWEDARADWIAEHDGDATAVETAPADPAPTDPASAEPEPLPADQTTGGGSDTPATPSAGLFVIATPGPKIEVITGFDTASDKIVLDAAAFTSLEAGPGGEAATLDAALFEIAARADDADDFIMYKWKTGELFYDADGSGSGAQVQIAKLEERLSFSHTNILVTDSAEATSDPAPTSPGAPIADQSDPVATAGLEDLVGPGADVIVFDTAPVANAPVVINDFLPGTDKIVLDSSIFTSLAANAGGPLNEAFFEVAKRADDANDYVMYKWKTGEVFYDADGSGGGAQVLIAQLDARLGLNFDDFLVA